MGKPTHFNSIDKVLLYVTCLLLSTLMTISVSKMGKLEDAARESHDHEIRANIILGGMKEAQAEVQNGLKKIQRQVTTVCNTQRQYWPTHAKNCL